MKSNDQSVRNKGKKGKKKSVKRHIDSNNTHNKGKRKINIKKLKEIKEDRRSSCAGRRKKKKFDWADIAQDGKLSISFSPSDEDREEMLSILELTMRNPAKKLLVKKLGKGFATAYQRYRRALERAKGKRGAFLITEKSMKHAEQGGVLCIQKEVTPFEVLRYWHEHISDFRDGTMEIPPLTWVASEQAIETVACSDLKSKKTKPVFGNSFSNKELIPEVRKLLKKFGVDETDENFLLQIQTAAHTVSQGASFYIPKKMKKAVNFLVKAFFSK